MSIAFLSFSSVSAQEGENSSRTLNPGQLLFKVYNNPSQDKTDQVEIQGLGTTSFTASNTADGSMNSYKHALRITLGLLPVNRTANSNYQLIFYSPNENIQQAATFQDGTLNIFYPVLVYEDIKTKLEQAFAARKKVTVKVVQKPNGYREGTLIF